MIRRSLHVAIAVVALAAPTALTACGSDDTPAIASYGEVSPDETADYEYVVPYGTSVRINAGQVVDLMPQYLEVRVGETIRIKNQDSRDYMIGPFFVAAAQTLSMRFTQEGTLSGTCTMNPEGIFEIKVLP
ncbi:MAG: hypothetical protein RJB65_1386 [Actinomycetota bacterium]|jgi:hypothetical protein